MIGRYGGPDFLMIDRIGEPQEPRSQLEHDDLAARTGVRVHIVMPLFEQLAIKVCARSYGIGDDLALRQCVQ